MRGEELACHGAMTQKRAHGSWFERQAAYSSDCSVEFSFRPSAIAAPPLGPSALYLRLRGWVSEVSSGAVSAGVLT